MSSQGAALILHKLLFLLHYLGTMPASLSVPRQSGVGAHAAKLGSHSS